MTRTGRVDYGPTATQVAEGVWLYDNVEKLKLVFVVSPALFHMVDVETSLRKFNRHVTLCGTVCDGADFTPFYLDVVQRGQPCPRCLEEFKAARAALGMIGVSASWVPLRDGDSVTVCNPDSERFKERGKALSTRTWDLKENEVYVKFDSFWSPLKFEKRELRLIIQP